MALAGLNIGALSGFGREVIPNYGSYGIKKTPEQNKYASVVDTSITPRNDANSNQFMSSLPQQTGVVNNLASTSTIIDRQIEDLNKKTPKITIDPSKGFGGFEGITKPYGQSIYSQGIQGLNMSSWTPEIQNQIKSEISNKQTNTKAVENLDIDKSLSDLTEDIKTVVSEGRTPDIVKLKQLYPEFNQVDDNVLQDLTTDMSNVVKEGRSVDMEKLKTLYPELNVGTITWDNVEGKSFGDRLFSGVGKGLRGGLKGAKEAVTTNVGEFIDNSKRIINDTNIGGWEKFNKVVLGEGLGGLVGGGLGDILGGAIEGGFKGATTESERKYFSQEAKNIFKEAIDVAKTNPDIASFTQNMKSKYDSLNESQKQELNDITRYALDYANFIGAEAIAPSVVNAGKAIGTVGKDVIGMGEKLIAKEGVQNVLDQSVGKLKQFIPEIKPTISKVEQEVTPEISSKIMKSIKPTVIEKKGSEVLKKFESDVVKGVNTILDYEDIKYADELGEMTISKDPETLREFGQAITQAKQKLFTEYDGLARQANGKGVEIKTDGAIEELTKMKDSLSKMPGQKKAITYIDEVVADLNEHPILDVITSQDTVKAYNSKLDAFYKNPNYNDVDRAVIDAIVNNKLRATMDEAIEKAIQSPEYAIKKDKYRALKNIEKEVNKRAIVSERQNARGLVDFTDIMSADQAVKGIIGLMGGDVAGGLKNIGGGYAMNLMKNWIKNMNSPDKNLRDLIKLIKKRRGVLPNNPIENAGIINNNLNPSMSLSNLKNNKGPETLLQRGGVEKKEIVKPIAPKLPTQKSSNISIENPKVMVKAPEEPLMAEARKYKSADDFVDKQTLYHGTSNKIEGGSLAFGKGSQLRKGGSAGGLFLSDNPKVADVFSFGGEVYQANPVIKSQVLDLTKSENINLFKEYIGKKYKSDGEMLEFTKQEFDYMFPEGKVDFATLNQDLAQQIVKKQGKIGVAFDEYAGDTIGKTYQIFEGEVPVYTKSQLKQIWEEANKSKGLSNIGKPVKESIPKSKVTLKAPEDLSKLSIKESIESKMIKGAGITNNPETVGFITNDGKWTNKIHDHAEMAQMVYGDRNDRQAVNKYMRDTKNIRAFPYGKDLAVDIMYKPNQQQIQSIAKLYKEAGSENIVVDIIDNSTLKRKDGKIFKSVGELQRFLEDF